MGPPHSDAAQRISVVAPKHQRLLQHQLTKKQKNARAQHCPHPRRSAEVAGGRERRRQDNWLSRDGAGCPRREKLRWRGNFAVQNAAKDAQRTAVCTVRTDEKANAGAADTLPRNPGRAASITGCRQINKKASCQKAQAQRESPILTCMPAPLRTATVAEVPATANTFNSSCCIEEGAMLTVLRFTERSRYMERKMDDDPLTARVLNTPEESKIEATRGRTMLKLLPTQLPVALAHSKSRA
jgi:hypothetical protein